MNDCTLKHEELHCSTIYGYLPSNNVPANLVRNVGRASTHRIEVEYVWKVSVCWKLLRATHMSAEGLAKAREQYSETEKEGRVSSEEKGGERLLAKYLHKTRRLKSGIQRKPYEESLSEERKYNFCDLYGCLALNAHQIQLP